MPIEKKYGFVTEEAKERTEDLLERLEKMMTEMIISLVEPAKTNPIHLSLRHAFTYYRELIWDIQTILGLRR
jgi:hypothetical protein